MANGFDNDEPMGLRISRLRGSMPADGAGARAFEKAARNPACEKLMALTLGGVSATAVAAKFYGGDDEDGQSPFALSAGVHFEAWQLDGGAARLFKLYLDAHRLTDSECKVVDLSISNNRKREGLNEIRRAMVWDCFERKLAGDPEAPNLILKPRIPIQLLGQFHEVEPDALMAAKSDSFYHPVEIKSYPDRSGKTDPSDMRSACRQAAVSVIALRQYFERRGMDITEECPSPIADIVLRKPGTRMATLSSLEIRGEVFSIGKIFAEASARIDVIEARISTLRPGASLDDRFVLDMFPVNYQENCRQYCALSENCLRKTIAADDPLIFGPGAKELLGIAGSVTCATEMMHGYRDPLMNAGQALLQERLQEAFTEFRKAVGYGE